jgi:hypothetical protein
MEFAFGVNHGWMPVGLPMKITKSEGAILKEVNNRPAIALYEDYFGPEEAAAIKEKNTCGSRAPVSDRFFRRRKR